MESATTTLRLAAMTDEDFDALARREHTHGPWSHSDLLLATIADGLERLTTVQLHRAGVKREMPEPIPRPGIRTRAARRSDPAAHAYLERLREAHRERQRAEGT